MKPIVIAEEFPRWEKVAREVLKDQKNFYHTHLDDLLNRNMYTKYTTLEEWKKDVVKAILKSR